ncbi:unnamed protein product [Malus baccata var. baccata]
MASTSTNPTYSHSAPPAAAALDGQEGGQQYHGYQHEHHHGRHDKEDPKQMMRNERLVLGIPPGWRFCPTDQELISFYLTRKLMNNIYHPQPVNSRITDLHIYDFNPKKLAEKYQLPEDPEMYFFTPRDKKYPNGCRPSRTAADGFWKATGGNKNIKERGKTIGYKNTLVFFLGTQKKGTKTDWIMQEYTIRQYKPSNRPAPAGHCDTKLDKWVLCKIYEHKKSKKNRKNGSVSDDDEEEINSSSALVLQGQESQDHPLLHKPLSPPRNNMNHDGPSTSYQAGHYNMINNNHSAYALNNGLMSPLGSTNGYGAHQDQVRHLAPMLHLPGQQMQPIPLVHSTDVNNQDAHAFNGITTYYNQSTQYGFGDQSVPMYNNGSQLNNNGYPSSIISVDTMDQYWLNEPLTDFDFLFDAIDEGVLYGMPDVLPLSSMPHINPALQSTKADEKSSTTPTDNH